MLDIGKQNLNQAVKSTHLGIGCVQKFDYSWLVEEIKLNLPKELDFLNEAKNAEQCRRNLNSAKCRVRGR